MKKLVLSLLIAILFTSCTADIKLVDEDGFSTFNLGGWLTENEVIIQSHDGFMVDGRLYTETVKPMPETVENVQNQTISVKVSSIDSIVWYEIAPMDLLYLE